MSNICILQTDSSGSLCIYDWFVLGGFPNKLVPYVIENSESNNVI